MEITGKVPPLAKTPYVKQSAKQTEKQAAAPAAKGDRVALSSQARELQAARDAVARMDAVDHERVARIKDQIAAGTYKVDAGRIADEVISHLEGLVGSDVKVTLEISVEVPEGIPETVVRIVSENCNTLKFKTHEFEKG